MTRFLGVLLTLVMAAAASADHQPYINLEWRQAAQTVQVGDTFGIGLYAVCDPGQTQLIRAADVVFQWDPTFLQLLGVTGSGAGTAPALSSELPVNDPYGLNGSTTPPNDGDGYFRWWAALGQPVTITEMGVLLTTFRFTALATTPATLVSLAISGGDPILDTRVFGGPEAGTIVTGTFGQATVTVREPGSVIPEPTAALLGLIGLSVLGLRPRR